MELWLAGRLQIVLLVMLEERLIYGELLRESLRTVSVVFRLILDGAGTL